MEEIEKLDKEINEIKFGLEDSESKIKFEKQKIQEKQNLDHYAGKFKKYYTFWNRISTREDLNYKLIEDMLNFDGHSMISLMYQTNLKYLQKTVHKQAK